MNAVTHIENVIQSTGKETILSVVDVRFEEFNGEAVRFPIVVVNGERIPVTAIADIARYTGLDKSNLFNLIERHELLKEWSVLIRATMADGKEHKALALTVDGLIALIFKISDKRIKNEKRRENVFAFRKWAIPAIRRVLLAEHIDSHGLPFTSQEMNVIFEMIKHYEKTKSVNTYQLLKKTLQKVYPDIILCDNEAMDKIIKHLGNQMMFDFTRKN